MIEYLSKKHTIISKGFAIIIIIICHLSALIFPTNIARIATPLGGIGVAIFLFLSGYGINESYKTKGLNNYWIKKITNVVIPYILVFIIYAIINYNKLNILQTINLFFTFEDAKNYYYWYIGYQIICYIIYYIATKISKNIKVKYLVLICSFIACFILLNEIRAEQSLSFLLGVIVSDYNHIKEKLNNNKITYILIIVGIIMLGIKQFDVIRELPNVIFKLIQLLIKLPLSIGIINIIFRMMKTKLEKKLNHIFEIIGNNSYEIFLSHGIAIIIFEYFQNNIYNITIFIIITTLLSIILKKMKNKIKYILLERN